MATKVLIVEDEAAQALSLSSRLAAYGLKVSSVFTGEEGLEKARTEHPDLILLDIILPTMSGVEVCEHLKEDRQTRDIPIILVTASGMKNLEARCKTFGADACVVKPYDFSELLEKMRQLLPPRSITTPPLHPPGAP